VIIWEQREESPESEGPLASVLGDEEVARWIDENAVASRVDIRANKDAANREGVRLIELPCLDLIREDGLRVARIRRGSTPTDFLAAVIGYSSDERVERPTGEAAKEPFRWLAWGNQRFSSIDAEAGPDATDAYRWLLTSADAYRPGFRARFLEFLINRLNLNRSRHSGAQDTLARELDGLRRLMLDGRASRRDVYEYTRFAYWLRQEHRTAELFVELCEDAGEVRAAGRARVRLWLLDAAAPHLARAKEHAALDAVLGDDPADYFRRRIAALPADDGAVGPAAPAGVEAAPEDPDFSPLPHVIPDDPSAVWEDAGWVYYALLDADRAEDAEALARDVAGALPGVGAWAEFANRAMELGRFDEAARVIAAGREALGEPHPRLERMELRLASMREAAKREAVTPAGSSSGDGEGEGGGAPRR